MTRHLLSDAFGSTFPKKLPLFRRFFGYDEKRVKKSV